ncbi:MULTISPECIES: carboxysome shell carbonic anhydrase [Aphanothece]|uniref:carboxysome shell carbonic anhydrase n=1 Tax=Aphanothece TaxID=1121 RepID=UPI00398E8068
MPRRTRTTAPQPLAPTAPRRRPVMAEAQPGPVDPVGAADLSAAGPVLRGTRARAAMQAAIQSERSLSAPGARPMGRRRVLRSAAVARRDEPGTPSRAAASAPRQQSLAGADGGDHPLTDSRGNLALQAYDTAVKDAFDRIVPVLKHLSAVQHEDDFVTKAQEIARRELGFDLPLPILETAWVSQLDMRTLFAWCVFQTYEQVSQGFFCQDPLEGQPGSPSAEAFNSFLLACGFHLLDITPCADGRLAHAIAFSLRLPFSSVRRRPHAGALFDVENTVNRWVKTEHLRYREAQPNPAHADTRYLKVVLYHFSSRDPQHEGCAAHGSNDALAASCGLSRLQDFQQAVENSFCCGASVDLLLIGIDTDTDAIRVHVPGMDGSTNLERWLDAQEVYATTRRLGAAEARERITEMVRQAAASAPDPGMVTLVARLLEHNLSQIDYVRRFHGGSYSDAGHAERFIGVGIGFKEIHLRNLTYFAYMDTVEEGAADLDVGVKIFTGLNVSRGLPVPVVVRFDYHGQVPGARERAVRHCQRVQAAIENRYAELFQQGLLHALLTVRDQDRHTPPEAVGSTITFATGGGH